MERFFIIDKFNSFFDWGAIIKSKSIDEAELKTNLVDLDGHSGSLDLTEALTGEVQYKDRKLSATFWTSDGNRAERERLLKDIRRELHGRKVKIIEPDDPAHYFYGRVTMKPPTNNLAYAEFTLEATCEPWRYAIEETAREIISSDKTVVKAVINNGGVKTLSPIIDIEGIITLTYCGRTSTLKTGSYKISDFKIYKGINIVEVYGNGSVTFTYREADL